MIIDSPISQALTLLALTYILRFTWNCERSGLQKGPVNAGIAEVGSSTYVSDFLD